MFLTTDIDSFFKSKLLVSSSLVSAPVFFDFGEPPAGTEPSAALINLRGRAEDDAPGRSTLACAARVLAPRDAETEPSRDAVDGSEASGGLPRRFDVLKLGPANELIKENELEGSDESCKLLGTKRDSEGGWRRLVNLSGRALLPHASLVIAEDDSLLDDARGASLDWETLEGTSSCQ